ncbi:MAG: CDP-diacylglycerol--glycerol-3-phosphate 3-phosphatidyltransferase [Chlamydiia bacterium]|nr:CDP-diacylglycerol--glycerol-3-phosphate 3-phosphatidyltransferase [Chlamydiia bacterium]MCB1115067.1 CDP-diacylglycerol--glycerol-3-phosphate 3-phosphatidyltransferase [Chlamydiia bacterium]
MKLPLILTMSRIFMSPIFLIFYLKYQALGISLTALPFVLLFLLALSELTDFFDGFLARKFNLVTELGKILDPMADSITRLTILLTFTQGFIRLPLFLVFVFVYRDAMISTLRTVCAFRGVTLAARTSGKIKAVLQAASIFAILILMIPYSWGAISLMQLQDMSLKIISAAAIYTVFAGAEYIYANRSYIKQAWQ